MDLDSDFFFFVYRYEPLNVLMVNKRPIMIRGRKRHGEKAWSDISAPFAFLLTLISHILKLPASIHFFLRPLCAAWCLPSPRASMKVRQGVLIIANYRNIGLPWWDQSVSLQAGAEVKAGGGKELQLKTAFSTVSWSIYFLVNVILMQQVAQAAEQT